MIHLAQSRDIGAIANLPLLWILALCVFAVIILQSTIYMRAVKRNAESADMSKAEAMSLSGAGWMISALILTPIFKRGSVKLQQVNPALMSVVPGAALLAAFAALTMTELPKSTGHIVAVAASAVVMLISLLVAGALNLAWLREWALGFAIVGGLVAAYFAHYAGLGPAA